MGGSHHSHSYVMQTAAFLVSMLLPASALFLVAGAYWERFRRRMRNGSDDGAQGTRRLPLAAEWGRD